MFEIADYCDECGKAVVADVDDAIDGYGWADDGSLLCYPCLDAENERNGVEPDYGGEG